MQLLAMFAAAFLGGWIFPWWWPALPAYALGLWRSRRGRSAFLMGFFGTGGAWLCLAGWIDAANHHILSARIIQLFHLPAPWMLVGLAGAAGGLIGGGSAWSGYLMGRWIRSLHPSSKK